MAKFKKRHFPKREDVLKGTPYDSLFERDLHLRVLQEARFHDKTDHISYTVPHTYEPDFVLEKEGITYFIETKGRFRDSTEARKYLFVRKSLEANQELVFVWNKANTIFPFAKKRKDGTKATQEEWATKNGFRHWVQTEFRPEVL